MKHFGGYYIFALGVSCLVCTATYSANVPPVYEVPDQYFIKQQCSKTTAEARKFIDQTNYADLLPRLITWSQRSAAKDLIDLCDGASTKRLSADDWLIRFDDSLADFASTRVGLFTESRDSRQPFPQGMNAYAMLLFPSSEWVEKKTNEDVQVLHTTFAEFGRSIDNKGAAIWFWDPEANHPDVQRSKYYADILKLPYNDGPYLVVTRIRPDLLTSPSDAFWIRLESVDADRVVHVLNILEEDLRRSQQIERRALMFEEIKQRFVSLLKKNSGLVKELGKSAAGIVAK